MDVLLVLAEHAEEVVLRETLLDRVWGRTAATADESLTRAITQLRQAIGDSSRDPEFIQTIPRRGYRLLKPVVPLKAAGVATQPASLPESHPVLPAASSVHRRRVILGAAAAIGFFAAYFYREPIFGLFEDSYQPRNGAGPWLRQALDRIEERTFESLSDAIGLLERAIELDDEYAQAHVEYAFVAVLLPFYATPDQQGFVDRHFTEARSKLFVATSMPFYDKFEAKALGIHAFIDNVNWKWVDAADNFARAFALGGDDADLHHRMASFLSDTGDFGRALDHAKTARNLDKDSPVFLEREAVITMWLGDYEGAARLFEEFNDYSKVLNPDAGLVWSYIQARESEAPDAFVRLESELERQFEGNDGWVSAFINALESPGSSDLLMVKRRIREQGLEDKYVFGAMVFLEQWDDAIEVAIRMAEDTDQHSRLVIDMLWSELARDLRAHEDFPVLLTKIGLVDYFDEGKAWPTEFCHRGENDVIQCY